jgi:N utilization substance protein B
LLLNAIKASKFYIEYMKEPVSSFEDRQYCWFIFGSNRTEWKLYEFLMTTDLDWWYTIVNTHIMKQLKDEAYHGW